MVAKSHTLGPGSLKLGETASQREFAAQLTKCAITPSVDTDDDVPVLSGEVIEGDDTITWEMGFTVNQDYDLLSLEDWCLLHQGEKVPFVFTPSLTHARLYIGIVKVRPLAIGGDVKKKNTSDGTFPLIGAPTPGVRV